jgi:ankyrin repeat protein
MGGGGKRRARRVKKTRPTIWHAAREGLIADLEILLQLGGDINEIDVFLPFSMFLFDATWRSPYLFWAPLHYACLLGRKDMVKFLIEHNADVNKMTEGVLSFFTLFL